MPPCGGVEGGLRCTPPPQSNAHLLLVYSSSGQGVAVAVEKARHVRLHNRNDFNHSEAGRAHLLDLVVACWLELCVLAGLDAQILAKLCRQ